MPLCCIYLYEEFEELYFLYSNQIILRNVQHKKLFFKLELPLINNQKKIKSFNIMELQNIVYFRLLKYKHFVLFFNEYNIIIQPQLIWDYPLNLSILIRGGKETNKDFLSSGERKEISSALSHFVYMANVRCSVWNINILV